MSVSHPLRLTVTLRNVSGTYLLKLKSLGVGYCEVGRGGVAVMTG